MSERSSAAAALGLCLLAVATTVGMTIGRDRSDLLFYASAFAQSGGTVAAGVLVARSETRAATLILVGAAILLRAYFVFQTPTLSGDVYRYVWDGRVVNAGFNPYAHIPADPVLEPLRDPEQYGLIDKRDYAVTIYPPVAEGFFALVTRFSSRVWAMKLAMTLAELVAVLAVARLLGGLGRPRGLVVGYLLHPAPIWEIAGNGHVDALAIAFLYAAFGWSGGALRPYRSAAILTFGALAKPSAGLGLPGVWRPFQIVLPLFVAALLLACYLPFIGAGPGVLGFLPNYLHEQGLDTGQGFYWLALLGRLGDPPSWATSVYVGLAAVVMLAFAIASRWRGAADSRASLVATARLLVVGLLLLTPTFPWYALMALPMTALLGWWSPLALSSGGFLLYGFHADAPPIFARWSAAIGLAVAAAVFDAIRSSRKGGQQ